MRKILLLEADKLLAQSLNSALWAAGYKVSWHVDLQAAMDSADKTAPNMVVLDLALATRSGMEFLYEFRSYPDWASVPIVIFSSLSEQELENSMTGLGDLNISSYLYKPATSLKQLIQTVHRHASPQTA